MKAPNECGGVIKHRTTIEAPVIRTKETHNCIWWIKAPRGYKARIEIKESDMYDRYNELGHPLHGACAFEGLEIRQASLYEGHV